MENTNESNLTCMEIREKIQKLQEKIKELREPKEPLWQKTIVGLSTKEAISLDDDAKTILALEQKIKYYREMFNERAYMEGTTTAISTSGVLDEQIDISWGINEVFSHDRKIFYKGIASCQPITVVNYGEFRFIEGEQGVRIEEIKENLKQKEYEILPYLRDMKTGRAKVKAEDVGTIIGEGMKELHEKIRLLRITKGEGENYRDYFILSSISERDLTNPEILKFFLDYYCSDAYLKKASEGENGIYAGGIKQLEDDTCRIAFNPYSIRAAKLAQSVPGTTQLFVDTVDGKETLKVPGEQETLKQVIDRLTKQLYKERQEGR